MTKVFRIGFNRRFVSISSQLLLWARHVAMSFRNRLALNANKLPKGQSI